MGLVHIIYHEFKTGGTEERIGCILLTLFIGGILYNMGWGMFQLVKLFMNV